jgi:hypothetical protein
MNLKSDIQAIPIFKTEYENFGKGSCGTYTNTLIGATGADVSSFLSINGNFI